MTGCYVGGDGGLGAGGSVDSVSSVLVCCSMFSVGTKDGFKIFDARNGRLCYEKSEIFTSEAPFRFCGNIQFGCT